MSNLICFTNVKSNCQYCQKSSSYLMNKKPICRKCLNKLYPEIKKIKFKEIILPHYDILLIEKSCIKHNFEIRNQYIVYNNKEILIKNYKKTKDKNV